MSEHEKTIREALHEYESCALSLNSDAGKWSAGEAQASLDALLSEHRAEVERAREEGRRAGLEAVKQRVLDRCCMGRQRHGDCEHQPCDYYENVLGEIHILAAQPAPKGENVPTVCEHGDHPAPPGKRFCTPECKACEQAEADHGEGECAGLCVRAIAARQDGRRAGLKEAATLLEAAKRLEPHLPRLDGGPIRFSEHAQAAGALRAAISQFSPCIGLRTRAERAEAERLVSIVVNERDEARQQRDQAHSRAERAEAKRDEARRAYKQHLAGTDVEREELRQLGLVDESGSDGAGTWRNVRAERAESDNAVLLEDSRTGLKFWHGNACAMSGGAYPDDPVECADNMCRDWAARLAQLHPGSALLERLRALEQERDEAERLGSIVVNERDEARQQRDHAHSRSERAEADNAALLVFVTGDAGVECEEGPTNCGECGTCLARKIKANPHPGTALLERMRTLESERNGAEKVNAALTEHVRALEQERDEARAELEAAWKHARKRFPVDKLGVPLAEVTKALMDESLPKARVLDVLDAVEREPTEVAGFTCDEQQACDIGWNGAVKSVRESLGLDNEETGR